ncbi:MAG TPA: DUF5683 domain-containing protein [Ignavibacteriaceae bacterium]|nr:DUF5683 domain-containing protein [Ignavibacteriaceae bacterium]
MKHNIYIISLFLLFTSISLSQEVISDSVKLNNSDFPEVSVESNDSLFIMTKSPWGAMLRSAAIPGWGQFYNESYWKIPVIWGVMGWFIYNWIDNNNNYQDYRDLYINDPSNSNKRLREFYRDNRDLFAIYLGLTYVANLVDAYVDAHMFDFDVSEDPVRNSTQLNIKYFFGRR